ncbi:Uncharacterised protein [Chromobacterium violaceum]|uniref:Uncharacterized protein n=1 Tax=Chromobacterium violaceum TaxID=536 RepID=A0A447T4R5_CHRVL|nr:Uncharacterised protein [Chromobacterium violaceum]
MKRYLIMLALGGLLAQQAALAQPFPGQGPAGMPSTGRRRAPAATISHARTSAACAICASARPRATATSASIRSSINPAGCCLRRMATSSRYPAGPIFGRINAGKSRCKTNPIDSVRSGKDRTMRQGGRAAQARRVGLESACCCAVCWPFRLPDGRRRTSAPGRRPQRCQAHLQACAVAWICRGRPPRLPRLLHPPLGCQRQRDARRCEALMAAQSSCEGMLGAQRRACVDERLPPAACSARGGSPARRTTRLAPPAAATVADALRRRWTSSW